jgi:hypothetical protein
MRKLRNAVIKNGLQIGEKKTAGLKKKLSRGAGWLDLLQ